MTRFHNHCDVWVWVGIICTESMQYVHCYHLRFYPASLALGTTWIIHEEPINTLWTSDPIWRHRTGSTLTELMVCCLTAPNYNLTNVDLSSTKSRFILLRTLSLEDLKITLTETRLIIAVLKPHPDLPGNIESRILRRKWMSRGFPDGVPQCGDHDDVIKWKHFPRYWPFERGIHRSPVNSPHKGPVTRELWYFRWTEQTLEQIIEMPVIWDAIVLIMTSL